MLLNKVLNLFHNQFHKIYEQSRIIKSLDLIILFVILTTFIISTFLSSDTIGCFCIITFLLTIARIITNPNDTLKFEKFELFLLIYLIIIIISVSGSTLLAHSFKGFLKTLVYLSFYFSIVHHLKYNKNNIQLIIMTIAGCVTLESFISIGQNFSSVAEISGWQDTSRLNPEDIMTRVYGTLKPLNPNLFGGYLISAICSLFGMASLCFNDYKNKRGIFFTILSLISIVAVFLTGCRGAYVALLAMFIAIFAISVKFFWENYKNIYLSILGFCFAGGIALLMIFSSIRARVFSIFAMRSDSSNSFRFNVYQSAVQMFKDNWLLGIGVGNQNFREIYGLYMKSGFDALSAYNIYLEIAVESGIFALIAFIAFLSKLFLDGIKFILKSNDHKSIIYASIALISIFGVLVHGLVDTVFFRPQIQIVFWTMAAILSNQLYSKNSLD